MIQGENSLWMEVLREKYGPSIGSILDGRNVVWPRNASRWWRDVLSLEEGGGLVGSIRKWLER